MREIKFRGLTSDGKWVYGDLEAHRHDNKERMIIIVITR